MEDREFFRELCFTVLDADRNIRFAGVVNDEGKLVVGEYRKDIKSPLIKASQIIQDSAQSSSAGVDNASIQSNVPDMANVGKSSFYASKMIIALNKQFERELGELNYNLAEYNKVKLLTIALSNRSNYYLCVSIDPVNDCQSVISKVVSSI